ncbi:MAG: hypothetical protein RIS76_2550 [Verrucomicrobiota bacterium]
MQLTKSYLWSHTVRGFWTADNAASVAGIFTALLKLGFPSDSTLGVSFGFLGGYPNGSRVQAGQIQLAARGIRKLSPNTDVTGMDVGASGSAELPGSHSGNGAEGAGERTLGIVATGQRDVRHRLVGLAQET